MQTLHLAVLLVPLLVPHRADDAHAPAAVTDDADVPTIELVESWPVETTLDHPDIRDAADVWLELVDGAQESLDFGQFYCSNQEDSRLEPIVRAIERAAARGVTVRWLADAKFAETYPETLARLDAHEGIEVRRFDVGAVMGGVLHAKYFVVDGQAAFVGSQNFDWRALEHIQELGVLVRGRRLVDSVASVFYQDWMHAVVKDAGFQEGYDVRHPVDDDPRVETRTEGGTCFVEPAFSPRAYTESLLWDLPEILDRIAGAKATVRVQLLGYSTELYGGGAFTDLDDALRAAAKRGVTVELLVADWSKRRKSLEALRALQRVDGIDVRFATIPAWSGGHVPFGRVIHAKYMVVDGSRSWIGTSNWEGGYFTQSRNLGFVVDGEAFGKQLERFFRTGWTSDYTEPLDPDAEYTPPRIGE